MKLAKKVLATVMAVAMIFALSALAFAAGTPTVTLEAGEPANGKVKVAIYFDDAIGLKSWDINVKYDATVLAFASIAKGADAKQVDDEHLKSNTFTSDNNASEAGVVKYSGYFKENLWSADAFKADAVDADEFPVNINSEHFHAATITFTVLNDKAANTALSVEVTSKDGVELAGSEMTIKFAEEEEPEPSSAEQEEPSSSEAASEEGSKPVVNPDTGDDKNTDAQTWAIAAAAGVAALAGAAFIVSKKRK